MTRHQQFTIISIIASALAIWFFIVTQVQPNKSDLFTLLTFFFALIVWLGSFITLILYWLRVRRSNREVIYAHIKPAVRQGFLASSAVALLLFLQLLRVITLWDAGLVALVFILFDLALRDTSFARKN